MINLVYIFMKLIFKNNLINLNSKKFVNLLKVGHLIEIFGDIIMKIDKNAKLI